MFVLVSNHFWKYFLVNAGVWLCMKNKFSGKYFQLTVCFSWFDPKMVWSENFHFKPFPDSRVKREREREREENIMPSTLTLHRSHWDHAFDFAPIAPRSHPRIASRWHRLHPMIASKQHRSHPRIASISLFPDLVPPSSVDRIWWIFFGWVLLLCLSIEKLYYMFVWKLRKCEKNVRNK